MDAAILDRCDESLYFPCPDRACRIMLLSLYFEKFVKDIVKLHNQRESRSKITQRLFFSSSAPFLKLRIADGVMTGEQLEEAADATAGFSGREISKLMVALQSSFYASNTDGLLTQKDAWDVLLTKVQEHKEKKRMISGNDDGTVAASSCHNEVENNTLLSPLIQRNEEDDMEESMHSADVAEVTNGNKSAGGMNATLQWTQPEGVELTEDSHHTMAAISLVSDRNAANICDNREDRNTPISVVGESEISIAYEDTDEKQITCKSVRTTEGDNNHEGEEERRITMSSLMSLTRPQDTDNCDLSLITAPLRVQETDIIHRDPPQTGKVLRDNKLPKNTNGNMGTLTPLKQKKRNGNRRRRMGVFC